MRLFGSSAAVAGERSPQRKTHDLYENLYEKNLFAPFRKIKTRDHQFFYWWWLHFRERERGEREKERKENCSSLCLLIILISGRLIQPAFCGYCVRSWAGIMFIRKERWCLTQTNALDFRDDVCSPEFLWSILKVSWSLSASLAVSQTRSLDLELPQFRPLNGLHG